MLRFSEKKVIELSLWKSELAKGKDWLEEQWKYLKDLVEQKNENIQYLNAKNHELADEIQQKTNQYNKISKCFSEASKNIESITTELRFYKTEVQRLTGLNESLLNENQKLILKLNESKKKKFK